MRECKHTKVPANLSDFRAWRIGADLALELLESCDNLDEANLSAHNRDGRPQFNVMHLYLLKLRERSDARVDVAFCAVLSDYIAGGQDGGVPDVSLLRRLSRKPIATAA